MPPDMWQQTNGTGHDVPTGYRPCPFCHAVIPWESERCPSCGRVLIERVGHAPAQTAPRRQSRIPWWTITANDAAARLQKAASAVQAAARRIRYQISHSLGIGGSSRPDPWATTSRSASWSVFQPAGRGTRSWWPASLPRPTQRERQILVIGGLLMAIVFLIAIIFQSVTPAR